jgi:hypothetical protein
MPDVSLDTSVYAAPDLTVRPDAAEVDLIALDAIENADVTLLQHWRPTPPATAPPVGPTEATGVKASSAWSARAPTLSIAAEALRAAAAWAVRAPTLTLTLDAPRATAAWSARSASVAYAVDGAKAAAVWSARDATVSGGAGSGSQWRTLSIGMGMGL